MKLQKKVTKSAKAETKIKTVKHGKGPFIAIGTKGTAMVLGPLPETLDTSRPQELTWGSFKAAGVSAKKLCESHAKGKPVGGNLQSYDIGCYVSNRKHGASAIRILPLANAVKAGLVTPVKLTATQGKSVHRVTGFVPAKFDTKRDKTPQYIATKNLPSGRIETKAISDKRAASLHYTVKF